MSALELAGGAWPHSASALRRGALLGLLGLLALALALGACSGEARPGPEGHEPAAATATVAESPDAQGPGQQGTSQQDSSTRGMAADAPSARRPNILFIGIDDLRPELGVYGSSQAKTPNIDKLAGEGVRFERAYCQVALCNPSRASLLSGRRPNSTRVYDLKTHFREALPDVLTLPQAFRQAGYRSWSLGKVFHGNLFDPPSWSEEPFLPERRLIYALEENQEAHKPRVKGPVTESADVSDDGYRDGLLTERAIELLRDAGEEPFFLALGYFKPHLPLAAPARYWALHPLESISLAANPEPPRDAPACATRSSGELQQYSGVPPTDELPDALARELIRAYHSCVSYVDAQVGRVLAALEESGHAQDTIVVLWSDHGWYLGEHGQWAKMGVHELGLRVPLIVRAPGSERAGLVSQAIVELVDLYPTLCELAGVPAPAQLEGQSFARALTGATGGGRAVAFSEHHSPSERAYSVRTERWRLNSWVSVETGREIAIELYDLAQDPFEDVNLGLDAQHRGIVEELRVYLRQGWPAVFNG